MSLKKFISSVFQPTKKDDLIKSLEKVFDLIEQSILPGLELSDRVYDNSPTYQSVERRLKNAPETKADFKGEVLRYTRMNLENLIDQREKIVRFFSESFREDIQREGLDYRRAHLLKLVDGYTFYADFCGKMMFAVTAELASDAYSNKRLLKEFSDYCTDPENSKAFAAMSKIAGMKAKEIGSALNSVKDISFSVETADIMEKTHSKKINPLSSGYLPVISDIWMFGGDLWNEWIQLRHQRATAQAEAARLNVLYLTRKKATASPEELEEIEKQISYYQSRINVLEQKIQDMEDA